MTKKIKINFEQVNNVIAAIDDYSEQFGTSKENLPIEKQYWTEYFKQYPNQKQDLIDIYSDLESDNLDIGREENDQSAIESANNCRVIIDFVQAL